MAKQNTQKKEYTTPKMKSVRLKNRTNLLQCSGDDCVEVIFNYNE